MNSKQWIWGSLYSWFSLAPFFPYHAGMDQWNLIHCPWRAWQKGQSHSFIACQSFGTQLKVSVKIKITYICYFLIVQVDNHSKNYSSSIFSSKLYWLLHNVFWWSKELMLTSQMNWEHPFDAYQLGEDSTYKGSDNEYASPEEMNLNPYVFISHILIMLDLVQWCILLGWPPILVCLGQS